MARLVGIGVWVVPAVIILGGPAAMWLGVRHEDADTKRWAIGLAATVSIALAVLARGALERRRDKPKTEPPGSDDLALERWRLALRNAVLALRVNSAAGANNVEPAGASQLEQMLRESRFVEPVAERLDTGRPCLNVRGRTLRWGKLTGLWDERPHRLVILGDPGYGKTIAALTLIDHINDRGEAGAPVAELFRLGDWQRWRAERAAPRLGAWMADQLTVDHPWLDRQAARQLVARQLVVPVLDGLDEIADREDRVACVSAIDDYGGRGATHRAFILTSRTRDYNALAPKLVDDDERVELIGLQRAQISERLRAATGALPAWDRLRDAQAAGHGAINELLGSPLYLAITLQVYRGDNPTELLDLRVDQARQRLWGLLLAAHADSYLGATREQVGAWLTWIAGGLQRTERQRFMLHELYLLDPEREANVRRFRMVVGLVFGLVAGLLAGLVFGLVPGLVFGLIGVGAAVNCGPVPAVRAQRVWRERLRYTLQTKRLRGNAVLGLIGGLIFGLIGGLIGGLALGLVVGLLSGLLGGLVVVLGDLLEAEEIRADVPQRFGHADPDAVLAASRVNGLVVGLVLGLVIGLVYGLVIGLLSGLVGGVFFGLFFALDNGLDAWMYYHWLQRRLARRRVLPVRLAEFLSWCARDERGWLRITDAYEFRHRELLDHLAPTQPVD